MNGLPMNSPNEVHELSKRLALAEQNSSAMALSHDRLVARLVEVLGDPQKARNAEWRRRVLDALALAGDLR